MIGPYRFLAIALAVPILAVPFALSEQPAPNAAAEDYVRAHYTKYEFRIPMRDGVRLFTAVYVPKASAFPDDPGPYPFLMDRTPYSVAPYGEDRYPAHLGPSLRRVREFGLHLRLPGRARALDERGDIR